MSPSQKKPALVRLVAPEPAGGHRPTATVGSLIGGKYRIVEDIGRCEVGTVLLAHDETLERDVAIVLASADLDKEVEERFLASARALARVRSDNVITIYSLGELQGAVYVVTELTAGIPLKSWLRQHSPLSPESAFGVFQQLCAGLEALHEAGCTHGEISPASIVVGPGSRVALAGLGMAGVSSSGSRAARPSAHYRAPELSRPMSAAGGRLADIYSLGVVAFQLFTGTMPHRTASGVSQPHAKHSTLAPPLSSALLSALAESPPERPASATAFLDAVRSSYRSNESPVGPFSILVVDDDPAVCSMLTEVIRLSLPKASVEHTGDGEAALAKIDRSPPTIALVDLRMPKLNGLELLAALKAAESTTRVVIMSAFGTGHDWRVLAELGAEAFLPKPIDADQLLSTISHLVSQPPAARCPAG